MRGELLLAGERLSLALQHRQASGPVGAAFTAVARGVERNDRRVVENALAAAQAAVLQYRGVGGADEAADPDLEALTLTLDRVAALATPTKDPQP
jgi:hypothetical protein